MSAGARTPRSPQDPLAALYFQAAEPFFLQSPHQGDSSYADSSFGIQEEADFGISTQIGVDVEEARWSEITSWLSQVYAPSPSPPFEKNPETFGILYHLYQRNRHQNSLAQIHIDVLEGRAHEYRVFAKRMQDTLDIIGLNTNDFSKNGVLGVKTLVDLAFTLGLGGTDLSSYQKSLMNLTMDTADVMGRLDRLTSMREIVRERAAGVAQRVEDLKRILAERQKARETKEEDKIREWTINTTMLSQKAKEYKKKLAVAEKEYAATRVEADGLRFTELQTLEDGIRDLGDRAKEKRRILAGYKDLPPDIRLARLKLIEAEETLTTLNVEKEKILSNIADNVQ